MGRRSKTTGPVDSLDMLERIGTWAPPAGYGDDAKYRDFRKVLIEGGASAEQCRRVLNQIMAECGVMRDPMWATPVGGDGVAAASVSVDTHMTFQGLGKQHIGRWLLSRMMSIPRSEPLPEQVQSDPNDQ